jgi:hypothetical protein
MQKKLPAPATVLASIALLVSLSGTAIAAGAVPLAKKALFASNAGRLQGKTAKQIAAISGPATSLDGMTADDIAALPGPATTLEGKSLADVVAMPGPASTAAGLVSSITAPFSLGAADEADFSASCPAGSQAISGGYSSSKYPVLGADTHPSSDTTWSIHLVNLGDVAASGVVYAICLK